MRDEKETKPADKSDWKINGPPTMKGKNADTAKVVRILGELASLKSLKVITDKPTKADLETLKLDPAKPRVKITLKLQGELTDAHSCSVKMRERIKSSHRPAIRQWYSK